MEEKTGWEFLEPTINREFELPAALDTSEAPVLYGNYFSSAKSACYLTDRPDKKWTAIMVYVYAKTRKGCKKMARKALRDAVAKLKSRQDFAR